MLKLLDLNIWMYTNFDERMPSMIKLIKEQDPDVITLQEVTDDAKFNKWGDNQAKQLARELGYPYCTFYLPTNLQKESPKWAGDRRCLTGEAILSKYPLYNITKKRLKRQSGDKHYRGILYAKVKLEKQFEIMVVHFSNDDVFSLLHLNETLRYIKRKGIKPIIVGDFNIRKTENLVSSMPKDYTSSFSYKNYISYPSENETLDYILVPKGLKFEKFECLNSNVSDHKALTASIQYA